MVEFTILAAFLMIVVFLAVVEDGGVLDNLQQHEQRYINSVAAP